MRDAHLTTINRTHRRATAVPAGVFVAGVVLAVQGIMAMLSGVLALAQIDRSGIDGSVLLSGGALALAVAFGVVSLRRWARITAVVLEITVLAIEVVRAPGSLARAAFGAALAVTVVVLLLIRAASDAFPARGGT